MTICLIGTYNSCKQVSVPSTGQLAIDLMCGSYGSRSCTAQRWFHFMGDTTDNPYTPFQINYKNATAPVGSFTPLDPGVTPCSAALSVSSINDDLEEKKYVIRWVFYSQKNQLVHVWIARQVVQCHPHNHHHQNHSTYAVLMVASG